MPKYVYQGLTSGTTFELEQRISDPALTHHPETGEPVKRLIGRPAIAFKGSGFYANDSRSSGGERKASSAGGEAKSDSAPSGDAGSGSTPSASDANKGGSSEGATSASSPASGSTAASGAPAATPVSKP
jgi:predicted nucleic acid-binding Zn ribbon protein